MKNDTFIAIQDFRKRIFNLRILLAITLFITILTINNKIFRVQNSKKSIIARVKIEGIISNGTTEQSILDKLSDENIKGVILDINSGGGDVVESEKLYTFFKKISEKKPVVSMISGVGASGAYMIAMASNYIIAYNTSIVGSIGVILQSYEITDLAKKIGISLTNYKSSPLKAAPNLFEKITPDVDMVISQQINDIYDYFLSIFIEQRKIKIAEAQEIANGQIYTGRQALEFGLIDKIGGLDEVKEYLKDNNIDIENIKIVNFDLKSRNSLINKYIGNINQNSHKIMAIYGDKL